MQNNSLAAATESKQFVVGGAVRDTILNMRCDYAIFPKDIDYLMINTSDAEMRELYGEPIGADFPVWLDEKGNEVALARVERSIGDKTTDFTFTTDGVTLEDDLSRRDLTINAMAVRRVDEQAFFMFTSTEPVIDPYNGLRDLQDRVLRHTTDAFAEDPLRVLRVARFYARYHSLGFTVAKETRELCEKMVADGMLDHLPQERVWLETMKALSEKNAHMYFSFLGQIGFCSQPRAAELMSLKHYNHMKFQGEETQLIGKWAAFDHRNRYTSKFGATKRFQKTSEILMQLNVLHVYDSSVVIALQQLGAYKNGREFEVALSQMNDVTKQSTLREIIAKTMIVRVDVEPGPQYGAAQLEKRMLIAENILHCA
ncbi:tRNA nucleotidyltransferase [Vibrio phage D527]